MLVFVSTERKKIMFYYSLVCIVYKIQMNKFTFFLLSEKNPLFTAGGQIFSTTKNIYQYLVSTYMYNDIKYFPVLSV